MSKSISNVRVGEPDTEQDAPSHVKGVDEGNRSDSKKRAVGFIARDGKLLGTASRSTGIKPEHRNPIDPRSPNLSPA